MGDIGGLSCKLRNRRAELGRDLVIGNYLARYLVHEKEVYVLRIWHQRENCFLQAHAVGTGKAGSPILSIVHSEVRGKA